MPRSTCVIIGCETPARFDKAYLEIPCFCLASASIRTISVQSACAFFREATDNDYTKRALTAYLPVVTYSLCHKT